MNNRAAALAQAARGPVLLILLGVLFALEQAGVLEFARSWPLIIIAIGLMKLLERMVVGPAPYLAAPRAAAPPAASYGAYATRTQAPPPPGGTAR